MRVFPAFATTAGRWCTETHAPRASLGETDLHSMTAPPEEGCGQQRVASTIFPGHLSLKGTPFRASHLGGRQAEIGELRRTQRLMGFQRRVLRAHNRTSRKSEDVPYPKKHLGMLTLSQ